MINSKVSPAVILIVDDEPQVITALKDLLEDDYRVLGQSSAAGALDLLHATPDVSLIISDQRMPEMSGHEFLAKAHEVSAATRILMTGYSDLGAVIQAINEGKIFGFISKPWEPAYLKVMVHKAVQYYDMMHELTFERTLLHSLMDSVPDEVSFIDPMHRFVRINRIKAESLGLSSPLEAVGRTRTELSSSPLAQTEEAEENTILSSGRPILDKVRQSRAPDGKEQWLSITTVAMAGMSGKIEGLVSIARDITARYLAQQALGEREQRYRAVYNQTPVMMLSIDSSGRIASVSDNWCESLGYGRDEVQGRQWTEFMTDASRRHFESTVMPELQKTGRLRDVPYQLVHKNGRVMDALLSASAEYDRDSTLLQCHAVSIDVTEKNALQQKLLQAQKLEAIGQLTGGLAHDFNNLLAVVIGNLDTLHDRLEADRPDPRATELVNAALAAAVRGGDLTQRLLAFARQQPLAPRLTDVNDLVSNIIKLLVRILGEHIEVSLSLAHKVPPVLVDQVQLEAALTNLATNARDAMPRGGRLVISTGSQYLDADNASQVPDVSPGEYATIDVRDEGQGMDQSTMERIFEPFFTTKEVGKGTGLGLSMVFGFVKQSNGHITVQSSVGAGTTFRLYLPRVKNEREATEAPVRSVVLGSNETILVVEDNDALRDVVVRQLKEFGYRVLAAGDAARALALLAQEPVDLLLTDIVMPGGTSGVELARIAVERQPSLKIALTSGFPDGEIRDLAESGAVPVLLHKPYRRAELAQVIRQALGKDDNQ
jgi:PAS domain S-box-containing protein